MSDRDHRDHDGSDQLARVNHEFRTPLTLMLGPIENAIARGDLPAGARAELETAHRHGMQLLRLVNGIIDLARSDAGHLRARLERMDLSRVTGELVSVFRPVVERSGLGLEAALDDVGEIYLDPEMWEKIVLNLLSNALKFTFEGRISITLRKEGEHVVLRVADTGTGVPEDQVDRLFDRFYRIPGTTGRSREGTGIGLAQVNEYVQAMDGTIAVTSKVGEGTEFAVRVPLGLEYDAGKFSLVPRPRGGARSSEAFLAEAVRWIPEVSTDAESSVGKVTNLRLRRPRLDLPRRPRILVVEPNDDLRAHVAGILATTGEIMTAADAEAATLMLETSGPVDVLVAEAEPQDGFTRLATLVMEHSPSASVMALLDRFDQVTLRGVSDDYVTKPFAAAELQARVDGLLEKSRLRTEAREAVGQAQKMEAIGHLTGGVAHDFSNLLVAVIGSLDLAQRRVGDDTVARLLRNAMHAAQRGAKLTKHLLSFSGKRDATVAPLNANSIVSSMLDILGQTGGGMTGLSTSLSKSLWPAVSDSAQLELALLNLANNAREAMPEGGEISIRTANVHGHRTKDGHVGDFVRITVVDTGTGMEPEVAARATEPFFTTKPSGQNSGMGLTQVDSMAKAAGGEVIVSSVPGHGTSVDIFLPRSRERLPALEAEDGGAKVSGLDILLVDDDDGVREVARDLLTEAGHRVVPAFDGPDALATLDRGQRFDLLLVDYAMPGMNGVEVAAQARRKAPGIKVLFATGYADIGALDETREVVLRKPFDTEDLEIKVARAMATDARPPGGAVLRLHPGKHGRDRGV